MVYCGEGKIAVDLLSCNVQFLCVDQYEWSGANKKCIKEQQCGQNNLDGFVNQCSNCSLVSEKNDCQNECTTQELPYYLKNQGCWQYCGNKIIANKGQDCLSSSTCIDGYEWKDQQCSAIQCSPVINDSFSYGLMKCSNCSLVSNDNSCDKCQNQFYYNEADKSCMKYCGQGKITREQYCSDINVTCIKGFQLKDNQCQKNSNCTNNTNQSYIIQCPNSSFVNDDKQCNQNCASGMYYYVSQKKCMVYCQNKVISSDSNSCNISHICNNGFQWDDQQSKSNLESQVDQNPSTNVSNNSQTDQTLLIIVIAVFAILILIIFILLRKQYLGNQKILDSQQNYIQQYQKIEAELKIIANQQKTSNRLISNEQQQKQQQEQQIQNNQIILDFNNENQEEEQHSSQHTIVQIQNKISTNDNDNQSSQKQLQQKSN